MLADLAGLLLRLLGWLLLAVLLRGIERVLRLLYAIPILGPPLVRILIGAGIATLLLLILMAARGLGATPWPAAGILGLVAAAVFAFLAALPRPFPLAADAGPIARATKGLLDRLPVRHPLAARLALGAILAIPLALIAGHWLSAPGAAATVPVGLALFVTICAVPIYIIDLHREGRGLSGGRLDVWSLLGNAAL